ncbi:MAG: matrixin family metalloprotease, partial [Burkholderiales bacterium]
VVIPIIQQILTTVCGWVSSVITTIITVVSQVCSWLPWPLSTLCNWVTQLITLVQTVWNWVCNTVISTIITLITWVLNFIIYVARVVCIIVNIIIGIPGLILCLLGLRLPKKVKVCIKVLTDEKGVSKVTPEAVENSIRTMIEIYRQCGIRVEVESRERIVNADLLSSTGDSFWGLFSLWHSWFSEHACNCCNQVTVFFVDKITGSSDGFTFWGDNWCRVDATAGSDPTIMAHEIGHILGLWHVGDNNDLMFPDSGPPTNPRNTLTGFQCCTMRLSPFVTS